MPFFRADGEVTTLLSMASQPRTIYAGRIRLAPYSFPNAVDLMRVP
jgi:hypothetical protein